MGDFFQTDFFKTELTASFQALELSSAFKNIYAIACGLCDGLGYGHNTKTKLIILAMQELHGLFINLKIELDESALPGTIGDLILTCASEKSRNFTFGKLLAEHSATDALAKIKSTVEGFHSLASVDYWKKLNGKLTLARFIADAVKKDNPKKVRKDFEKFIWSI